MSLKFILILLINTSLSSPQDLLRNSIFDKEAQHTNRRLPHGLRG